MQKVDFKRLDEEIVDEWRKLVVLDKALLIGAQNYLIGAEATWECSTGGKRCLFVLSVDTRTEPSSSTWNISIFISSLESLVEFRRICSRHLCKRYMHAPMSMKCTRKGHKEQEACFSHRATT